MFLKYFSVYISETKLIFFMQILFDSISVAFWFTNLIPLKMRTRTLYYIKENTLIGLKIYHGVRNICKMFFKCYFKYIYLNIGKQTLGEIVKIGAIE